MSSEKMSLHNATVCVNSFMLICYLSADISYWLTGSDEQFNSIQISIFAYRYLH